MASRNGTRDTASRPAISCSTSRWAGRRWPAATASTMRSATVVDRAERLALLEPVARDVRDAGRIAELHTAEGDTLAVEVVFAEEPAA